MDREASRGFSSSAIKAIELLSGFIRCRQHTKVGDNKQEAGLQPAGLMSGPPPRRLVCQTAARVVSAPGTGKVRPAAPTLSKQSAQTRTHRHTRTHTNVMHARQAVQWDTCCKAVSHTAATEQLVSRPGSSDNHRLARLLHLKGFNLQPRLSTMMSERPPPPGYQPHLLFLQVYHFKGAVDHMIQPLSSSLVVEAEASSSVNTPRLHLRQPQCLSRTIPNRTAGVR